MNFRVLLLEVDKISISMALLQIFEENLIKDGLELEYDDQDEHISLNFVKIHATREICRRYSEILRLRMPMKKVR